MANSALSWIPASIGDGRLFETTAFIIEFTASPVYLPHATSRGNPSFSCFFLFRCNSQWSELDIVARTVVWCTHTGWQWSWHRDWCW